MMIRRAGSLFVRRLSGYSLPAAARAAAQQLRSVDKLSLHFLVENTSDLLASRKLGDPRCTAFDSDHPRMVRTARAYTDGAMLTNPGCMHLAAHGLSVLVSAKTAADGEGRWDHTVLFDTGPSDLVLQHNAAALAESRSLPVSSPSLGQATAIVLSHGHFDHYGGLLAALRCIQSHKPPTSATAAAAASVPVYAHVRTQLEKVFSSPTLEKRFSHGRMAAEKLITAAGGRMCFNSGAQPFLIEEVASTMMVSGEVPRAFAAFEKGFPGHMVYENGELSPDPDIREEQFMLFHVRGKGLVVLSGCAHFGIVNGVSYARKLFGEEVPVYAVVGGFHLNDPSPETPARIAQTVDALNSIAPNSLIITGHCTGAVAQTALARAFPNRYQSICSGLSLDL